MATPPPNPPSPPADDVNLRDALEERYLAYALSTIMGRALPDARDGLKPVHRRILYSMHELRLDPSAAFKKCAKIVGDVMGDFHPHGDQAIYDALVRLAQDFSSRYPLIEGQGNFGNIDGDNPAAYRYTEARLTDVAQFLVEGIDEDAIDFRDNYSGEKQEPAVLPAAFPNLLANGAQGIAVGMATSIPPHNVAELCDAALYLIAHRDASSEQLLTFVPGPDFPTGGIIVEPRASIAETYRAGRGSFRLRARWSREDQGRGGWIAVVTEIPYMVQKTRLMEKLGELVNERKLPLVNDIRDESAEDVRLVIEPRARNVDPLVMMEQLFKLTELETRFAMNMNVLVDGVSPRIVSLKEALAQWLDHRRVVLVRRSNHRLRQIARRLELVAGMLVVFLNLDAVIRIIREEDEPRDELIRAFKLTEVQANYILDTRLRALRRLEEMQLRAENEALLKEQAAIDALLSDETAQWKVIALDIRAVKKKYGLDTAIGKRRTTFEDMPETAAEDLAETMIEREPITVVVSQKGWIRALKGHVGDLANIAFKGDDMLKLSFFTETTAKLLVFATNGKVFTLEAAKLPGGRGAGEPIRLLADIDEGADVFAVQPYRAGVKLLVASSDARGFIASQDDMVGGTRKGKALLAMDAPATLRLVSAVEGDHVAIVGENRKLLVFPLAEMVEMARGKGVRLQKYKDGGIADLKFFKLADGLTWRDSSSRTWTVAAAELAEWIGHRGEAGRLPPKGFPKNNKFG